MIGFDEASARLAAVAAPLGQQPCLLAAAAGRILAAPVRAAIAAPRGDVSVMDGYAVRDADLARLPATLRIAGASYPGAPFAGPLPAGECVRLFTGAGLPHGAERVIVQEEVTAADGAATFTQALGRARFIRPEASDFASGDCLLEAGTRLTPGALLAAGGGDIAEVEVWRRPRVALLATGDELVAPGAAQAHPYAVPDSVSLALAALCAHHGAVVVEQRRLGDRLAVLEAAAAEAVDSADVVVVTGGASVGERDHAKAMFAPLGLELLFSKVAMKPGKPVWAGQAKGRLVLGLPGNPTSALVCARLFLVPLLHALTGRDGAAALRFGTMPLAQAVGPVGERETFFRGVAKDGAVALFGHQDSNGQKVLGATDLLVRLPAGDAPVAAGTVVPVLSL